MLEAGAYVQILLGFWRLILHVMLSVYFGAMGMRFFRRLSDEVDAWFWKKNWRKAFLTLLSVFYLGATFKDCLLMPMLLVKVIANPNDACSGSFTASLLVFEVWKEQHAFISSLFLCFKVWFLCTSQEKLLAEIS